MKISPKTNFKSMLPKLKRLQQRLLKHLPFIVTLAILLLYMFVVWHIRALATSEPSSDAETQALDKTKIPKIDQKAINQIQSLENNSPEVKALFNEARNNPFHE